MNEIEIWKDITEFEGKYQASNLGRVKALNYKRTGKERILILVKNRNGYLQVALYKNGKRKMCYVHRLVYKAFNGKISKGMQVNHINECKTDNRLENLELLTHKENTNYGSRNERAGKKLSKPVLQYGLQGNFIKKWESRQLAGNTLGIDKSNISACCKGRLKTAYGFIWRYA